MQYLLTEEEMGRIRMREMDVRKLPDLEKLTLYVQHVATTMIPTAPQPERQRPLNGEQRPHGCIHVEDPRGPQYRVRYCDLCQVSGICPLPREWSK